jgi:uncharacterized protein
MCGGTASLCLDFGAFISEWQSRPSAVPASFLMIEYPGYGDNEGSPSPTTTLETTCAAVRALARHLKMSEADLASRYTFGILGHSLGCAIAMQWVAYIASRDAVTERKGSPRLKIDKVVLLSPFTSTLDMARRMVGAFIPGISLLLRHKYDNEQCLRTLCAAAKRDGDSCVVSIYHGDADEVVPVKMGRDLAASANGPGPVRVEYREFPGVGHNDIFRAADPYVHRHISGIP